MIDQAAGAQIMNYEQFLIAQLLFQDGTLGKTEEELYTMAQAIRNRGNLPTRQFGNSVRDIADTGGLILAFPDGTDYQWQRAVSATGLIDGMLKVSHVMMDAYEGGNTGAMDPQESDVMYTIGDTIFHREKRYGFNYHRTSDETLKARVRYASYTNFALASYLYHIGQQEKLEVKQSIIQVLRNIENTKLVRRSILQILRELNVSLTFPDITDQEFEECLDAVKGFSGAGYGTHEANGMQLSGGETIKLEGLELKKTMLDGSIFFNIQPSSGEIKTI